MQTLVPRLKIEHFGWEPTTLPVDPPPGELNHSILFEKRIDSCAQAEVRKIRVGAGNA